MAADKQIVLITGGNTGVGLEVARKLLREHGEMFHVIIGSRNRSKGEEAVRGLRDEGHEGVETVQLDVTSEESVAAAAQAIESRHGRLDVLHVNAGIAPEADGAGAPLSELVARTMATNVGGAAATVEHMAPLLARAAGAKSPPRLVFMSSGGGSLAAAARAGGPVLSGYPAYGASKAALNMLALHYHHRFPGWKVNMCCPGFRATRLNHFGAATADLKPGPLDEGAVNAVRLSLLGPDGESGTFTRLQGKDGYETVPW